MKCGEQAPRRGWIAPAYGRRVAAPMVVYSAAGPLPLRLVTVLYPQQRLGAKPLVTAAPHHNGMPEQIDILPANVQVRIDDTHVHVDRG